MLGAASLRFVRVRTVFSRANRQHCRAFPLRADAEAQPVGLPAGRQGRHRLAQGRKPWVTIGAKPFPLAATFPRVLVVGRLGVTSFARAAHRSSPPRPANAMAVFSAGGWLILTLGYLRPNIGSLSDYT
jgi:hypothetical protein